MRSFPASAMYLHVFLVTNHRSFFLGLVSLLLAPPLPPQPVQLAMASLGCHDGEVRDNLRITISSLYCPSWPGGMLYRSDCPHTAVQQYSSPPQAHYMYGWHHARYLSLFFQVKYYFSLILVE